MAGRRLAVVVVLGIVLGACVGAPSDTPGVDRIEPAPASVVDRAGSVAVELEQRQIRIDAQMRDPFSPP